MVNVFYWNSRRHTQIVRLMFKTRNENSKTTRLNNEFFPKHLDSRISRLIIEEV